MASVDLRDWLDQVENLGELRRIQGAHVDDDIGPIAEISERSMTGPAILYSGIQGFDPGRRILSNPISTLDRVALTVGFPVGLTKADYCDLWLEKTQTLKTIPPRTVSDGPVLENVQADGDVDLLSFPAPIWHKGDGGRYIGTGCVVITRDPDGEWVNLGTYRVMVVDDKHVTIYAAPGKHLSIVRDKLFAEGKSMPVAISLGHDPALLMGGSTPLAYGSSEYDYVGGLKGRPVDVLSGDYTGLPIPRAIGVRGWKGKSRLQKSIRKPHSGNGQVTMRVGSGLNSLRGSIGFTIATIPLCSGPHQSSRQPVLEPQWVRFERLVCEKRLGRQGFRK